LPVRHNVRRTRRRELRRMHACSWRSVFRRGDAGSFRPLCYIYGDANHNADEHAIADEHTDTDQHADGDDYTDINDNAHPE
jgi:hypothetical protein